MLDADIELAAPPQVAIAAGELAERCAKALAEPEGFPPLVSCVVPGDRVALALAAGTPCADEVVRGLLAALDAAGVEPARVTVVAAEASDASHLTAQLEGVGADVVLHNPADAEGLCFAGVTQAGHEVLLSRPLVEADMAIPVGATRAASGGRTPGPFAGLYPAFSSAEARRQSAAVPTSRPASERFATLADEAGWLLGAMITVQVTPGVAGGVAGVFAGPPDVVADSSQRLTNRLWTRRVSGTAELVVATLTGDAREQTWQNLGRALSLAERVAADPGALVFCTELAEPLDGGLAGLMASGDLDAAAAELAGSDSPDAETVAKLLAARERGPVYLMSRFDADEVEELGLAPVADEAELTRLVRGRPTCVALEGAQHATIEFAADADHDALMNSNATTDALTNGATGPLR